MVAITFDYRLANEKEITTIECIKDAKSAIRWTRENAVALHIDPDKIAASGFSAGGHLAACTGILKGLNEPGEDLNISSFSNALILWSACVNPVEDPWFIKILKDRANVKDCSPAHNIRPGLSATIIFHGKKDSTLPFWTAKDFTEKMKKAGNRCELHLYNCGHFFNDEYKYEVKKLMENSYFH